MTITVRSLEPVIVERTLTLASLSHGAWRKPAATGAVEDGAAVEIEATPDPGYVFGGWSADPSDKVVFGDATMAATSATLSGDATVTASFRRHLMFNFDSYTLGGIGGQDGWNSYLIGQAAQTDQANVIAASSSLAKSQPGASGKVVNYNTSIGGWQGTAYRDCGLSIDMSDPAKTYTFSYDCTPSYWGVVFGLGADLDADGKLSGTETHLRVVICDGINNPLIRLWKSDATPGEFAPGSIAFGSILNPTDWARIKLVLKDNKLSVYAKNLTDGDTAWTTLYTDVALGTDNSSAGSANSSRWKGFMFNLVSAGGNIDNIEYLGP